MTTAVPRNVAILLFPNVELLDFAGPYEVFSVAGRQSDDVALDVFTVAERAQPIRSRNGLAVLPDHTIAGCPPIKILLVPGGLGTRREMDNTPLVDWIRDVAGPAELVLSVCTGALLLASVGLLEGLNATTHHVAYSLLRERAPTATVHEGRRFVDNGKIITSAGISAGIDMSLHVVARLFGQPIANSTARHMEYEVDRS